MNAACCVWHKILLRASRQLRDYRRIRPPTSCLMPLCIVAVHKLVQLSVLHVYWFHLVVVYMCIKLLPQIRRPHQGLHLRGVNISQQEKRAPVVAIPSPCCAVSSCLSIFAFTELLQLLTHAATAAAALTRCCFASLCYCRLATTLPALVF